MQTRTRKPFQAAGLSNDAMVVKEAQVGHDRMLRLHNQILIDFASILDSNSLVDGFEAIYDKFASLGYLCGDKTKRELQSLYNIKLSHLKIFNHVQGNN